MIEKAFLSVFMMLLFNITGLTQSLPSSTSQQFLNRMVETYKREYSIAKDELGRKEATKKLSMMIKSFIVDSMKQRTDSLTVRVGRIKHYKDNMISTQLFAGDIEFCYYGKLEQLTEVDREAIRDFILNLKRGNIVRVSFVYQGGAQMITQIKKDIC